MGSKKTNQGRWGRGKVTLAEAGEQQALKRIGKEFGQTSSGVLIGIGDDAAVLRSKAGCSVLCQDTLVENVDFRCRWASPQDLGHKLAAVNLSDLAAMGAKPLALTVSLSLPPQTSLADMMAILRGSAQCAQRYGAQVVGGDLSSTDGPMVVSASALGFVSPKLVLKRGKARIGDYILVSGTLGAAAAGLNLLELNRSGPRALIQRQLRPLPQVELGGLLSRHRGVNACTDISDGLEVDGEQLLAAGQHIEWFSQEIPIAPAMKKIFSAAECLEMAMGGGEDFELIFSCASAETKKLIQKAQRVGIALSVIGEVKKGTKKRKNGQIKAAYEHFRV
tara:strand:- start:305 stop:1309 length:1005 start_codon:yes stop_codon:yes gene_type:complete